MVPPDDWLARVQHAARYGRPYTTRHARERMSERGASAEDVKRALLSATRAIYQPNEKEPDKSTVRVEGGRDVDGDLLAVVVSAGDLTRVVTVF